MRNTTLVTAAAALILLVVLAFSALFIVQQTEQGLVLRFGEPVAGRGLVTEPGLHFKVPFIETVVLLDNRLLDLETPGEEVVASDSQRIEVDTFARYRIVDPLKFYQTVETIPRANNQLAPMLNSTVRLVLGQATLPQIVTERRDELMSAIRDQLNAKSTSLGVAVVDVRIRRADLPAQISQKVFDRMISERQRQAADYRAQGAEESQKIRSKADRDVVVLRATAQQQADQIRGEGDANRNRIFAEAFGKDPDFFAFYRSMQAYTTSLKEGRTSLVLSPDSDFFRYFRTPDGNAAIAARPQPAPAAAKPPAAPGAPAPTPVPAPTPAPAAPVR